MNKKDEIKRLLYGENDLNKARVYIEGCLESEPDNIDYLYYYAKVLKESEKEEDILKAIELYKRLSQELNKDHNFLIGQLYLKVGNTEKAMKRFNRIKDYNLLGKYELAKLLKAENKYEESLKYYEEIRNTKQDKISLYKILKDEQELYKVLNKTSLFKEFLLNILNLDNKDAVYRILAEIYYNEKNYDEAEKYYLLCEKINPHVKNNYLGEIYYHKKDYEKALDYYFKCLETAKEEKRTFYYSRMGDCCYFLEMYEDANQYYLYLNKKAPCKQNYLKLGKSELMLYKKDKKTNPNDEHLNKAYQYFKDGLRKYPDDIFLKFELAKLESIFNRYNKALKYLDEILEVKYDRFTLIEKAKIYQKSSKFNYAISIYEKLLEEEESIYIRLDLGRCYHTLHMYEKALEQYDKILEISNNTDACAKLEKARTLKKIGETNEVDALFNELDDDNNLFYIKEKVKMLYKENKIEEAKTLLDELIKKHPNSSLLLYIIGWFNNNIGNYDIAIDAFKQAYKIDKQNVHIYLLGVTYFNKGDLDNAILELNKIKISNDFYMQASITLAKIYLEKKDLETAYACLYPIVETSKKSEVLALMFKIESLIGQNYVYKRYYNELSEESRNYIQLYMENDIKLSWEEEHVNSK